MEGDCEWCISEEYAHCADKRFENKRIVKLMKLLI